VPRAASAAGEGLAVTWVLGSDRGARDLGLGLALNTNDPPADPVESPRGEFPEADTRGAQRILRCTPGDLGTWTCLLLSIPVCRSVHDTDPRTAAGQLTMHKTAPLSGGAGTACRLQLSKSY